MYRDDIYLYDGDSMNLKALLIRYKYVSYVICTLLFILVVISLRYAIFKTYKLIVLVLFNMGANVLWEIIGIVDVVLVSIVLILFSAGIFELLNLISEEVETDTDDNKRRYIINQEIEDLKSRLAKMIIVVLIVNVFKSVLSFQITTLSDIVIISCTIAILAGSIYLIHKK